VKLLREGFNATMNDPVFRADIDKLRLTLDWVAGEQVAKSIAGAYAMPPEVVAAARQNHGRQVAASTNRTNGEQRSDGRPVGLEPARL
jgi:hypothetical protein